MIQRLLPHGMQHFILPNQLLLLLLYGSCILRGLQNARLHFLLFTGLEQIMLYPIPHRFSCILKLLISGQNDELYLPVNCRYLPYQLQPRHPRHANIRQNDIRKFIQNHVVSLDSVLAQSDDLNPHALPVDRVKNRLPNNPLVICNQQSHSLPPHLLQESPAPLLRIPARYTAAIHRTPRTGS